MVKKIIIDVDTGVDDAQAIMLALTSKEVDVLAITCVQGNADVENVCRNTLRVLKVCDRLDIPVYKGASKPLIGFGPDATHYHGKDGMGHVANPEEVDMSLIQSEPASLALLRLSKEYPGEITLVALAPLTNIALAIRLDPDFGTRLKEMFMMGGNIEGKGNTSPAAEFNCNSDPEAAFVTLHELRCPILNMSWETCLSTGMTMSWYDKWAGIDTKLGRFNKEITQHSVSVLKKRYRNAYRSCDLLAMATVVNSAVIKETVDTHATVELSGMITRGQMVVDWKGFLKKPNNVTLITKVDNDMAADMFYKMVE